MIAAFVISAAAAVTFEQGVAYKRAEHLPEAASVFAQLVNKDPRDVAALEQLATVLGWQQRYDEAIDAWQRALEVKPGTAAFALGMARVRYWKGDHKDALAGALGVLKTAPESFDALVLAGDISLAVQDTSGARAYYLRAKAEDATALDLDAKLARTEPPLWRRVDAGGTFDRYSTVRAREGLGFVQVSAALTAATLSAGFEQLYEFGYVDRRYNAFAEVRPLERVAVNARFAVTPGAHFLADWEGGGQVEVRATDHVTLLAQGKYLGYASGGVTTLAPGLRLEGGGFAFTALVGATLAPAGTTASVQARLAYEISEALTGQLAFSSGNEAIPQLPPATSVVGAVAALWHVSRDWGLRFDYVHEERLRYYAHDALSAAVTYKF